MRAGRRRETLQDHERVLARRDTREPRTAPLRARRRHGEQRRGRRDRHDRRDPVLEHQGGERHRDGVGADERARARHVRVLGFVRALARDVRHVPEERRLEAVEQEDREPPRPVHVDVRDRADREHDGEAHARRRRGARERERELTGKLDRVDAGREDGRLSGEPPEIPERRQRSARGERPEDDHAGREPRQRRERRLEIRDPPPVHLGV